MAERGGLPGESGAPGGRLASVTLDDSLLNNASPDIAHEREVAIYDLITDNRFALTGGAGHYALLLSIAENRLVFDVTGESDGEHAVFMLSLGPFRRIVRDYFTVCESYYEAIRAAPPSRIEAIDMGRRALHDEGSQVLLERLAGKVDMDFATARRLFTVVCALHWKG